MIDKTTKTILALIALGLWINAAMPLFRPEVTGAQDWSTIENLLKKIESDTNRIQRGACTNTKIC